MELGVRQPRISKRQVPAPLMSPRAAFPPIAFYFTGLIVVVVAGFWPSYFARFFDGSASFPMYFHFHATLMIGWMIMLVLQPVMIRRKKMEWDRLIGIFSYVFFPVLCVSTILIIHLSHNRDITDPNLGNTLLFQSKNFFILVLGYCIAIRYRKNPPVHARGMIISGVALIEPALTRLILNLFSSFDVFVTSPNFFWYASIPTILIIFSLFIAMIIRERRQRKARWVFPVGLGVYALLYLLVITHVRLPGWEEFSRWFVALPLT